MAEFVEVMKEKRRMCEEMELDCSLCGLSSCNNNRNLECSTFICDYSKQAEEIIMNWAKDNPVKTNADKFNEVFGDKFSFVIEGIEPDICDGIRCNGECSNCSLQKFMEQEYKEPKEETNGRAKE